MPIILFNIHISNVKYQSKYTIKKKQKEKKVSRPKT